VTFRRRLRRIVTHNLGWKLICLGVAVLLWLVLVAADNRV
jgi:hypothetical protein